MKILKITALILLILSLLGFAKSEDDGFDRNPMLNTQADSTAVPTHYQAPQPVSGFPQLFEYFKSNVIYPTTAINSSVEGEMIVKFIIDKNGLPKNIRFENSLGKAFEDEATRLVRHMPEWHPAQANGEAVEGKVSLPLQFKIPRE